MEQFNPKNSDLYRQVELQPLPPPVLNIVPVADGISGVKNGYFQSKNFRHLRSGYRLGETSSEFQNGIFGGTFILGGTLITVDNIDNLQSEIDYISSLGGGTISLVPGTYLATSSFTVPSGVTIDGNGSTIDFQAGAYQMQISGSSAYKTGTITINFGDTTVVGVGTTWTAAMVGQSILLGEYWYEITARTDNTHITIGHSFIGTNLAGDTYVIATTVDNTEIKNLTLTNNSSFYNALLTFRYANGLIIDSVIFTHAGAKGLEGIDSANATLVSYTVDSCPGGIVYNNVPFALFSIGLISNITAGTGLDLTRVTNTALDSLSIQAITGVGAKLTNVSNFGFTSFSIIECTSHGLELASGDNDIDIISGYVNTCGGDGIKLTATVDRSTVVACSILNCTGYGVNVADSTCDNNQLVSLTMSNNSPRNINDSGTGTQIIIDSRDGWNFVPQDWAYASATTITVPSGATTKYQKGDKIKLTQTTVKYFYIVAVANTVLTITGGSDYTLVNAAIGDVYYSKASNPEGFPDIFAYTTIPVGFSGSPTLTTRFRLDGANCLLQWGITGTSNSTVTRLSLPITATSLSGSFQPSVAQGLLEDNTVFLTTSARAYIDNADPANLVLDKDFASGAWTAAGTKASRGQINYEI